MSAPADPLGRALAAFRRMESAGQRLDAASARNEPAEQYAAFVDEVLHEHECCLEVFAELERLPAAQRAGGHDCWIYPDPPAAS